MPRMGKTEEDWNGLKLGFLKTVQPNSFSKLIPAACNFKNNDKFVFLGSLILSFTCNFFAYFKFHSDWGRVIGKIKQNGLDCRDAAPLNPCPFLPFEATDDRKQFQCRNIVLHNKTGPLFLEFNWCNSLPADVLWGSFVTNAWQTNPKLGMSAGRLLMQRHFLAI